MLPVLQTAIPGPISRQFSSRLRRVESQNVTFLPESGAFPVFWESGNGCLITDVDNNQLLDMTSAFGVSALGHGKTVVTKALQRQCELLLHGMGDVHPTLAKLELCERIADLSGLEKAKVLLGTSGGDAVESAIKTARIATGKRGVVAFSGGYHGLNLGALNATYRADFRQPFKNQLANFVTHLPYGDPITSLPSDTGAVLLEVVQARGGVVCASTEWLTDLRNLCTRSGILFIVDEVYTGYWRTGATFAFQKHAIVPDIIACGKILGGGMPISACIAPAKIMDAWPLSDGESLHTSTFLGHPLACISALRTLDALQALPASTVVNRIGATLKNTLEGIQNTFPNQVVSVRGSGLLLGLQLSRPMGGVWLSELLLRDGIITLPAGAGDVLELSPPFIVNETQIEFVCDAIKKHLLLNG